MIFVPMQLYKSAVTTTMLWSQYRLTATDMKPLEQQKYKTANKCKIDVAQPHSIKKYSEGMGGVGVMDKLLSGYRPKLTSKKWWWKLFMNS